MVGGFLAQGHSAWDALCAAVFVHGLAGELAPHGDRALIADDLLDLLGPAMRRICPLS
jgi:NAD(P)H-hydrate repair Nnr-like enzyme with NAD(P)H-hydrate dehydratase domain